MIKIGSQVKWFLIVASVLFLAGTTVIAYVFAHQFLVMNPSKDLPEINEPRIVIRKAERRLDLYDGEALIKTYTIALGSSPMGDKEIEGDRKTPEGDFYIFVKNPKSRFHLGLGVSYPNSEDALRGLEAGLITEVERAEIDKAIAAKKMPLQNTKLGGEIYIHGGGSLADWTHGCIALMNADVQEIYDAVPQGIPVTILP